MNSIKMNYWAFPGMKAIPVRRTLPDNERVKIIITTVCRYFGVDPLHVTKKVRKREIVLCRQVAMYFIKKYTLLSLKTIGRDIFKGKDHTTVIYSIRTISDQLSLKSSSTIKSDIRILVRLIKNKGI